jgi:hypothetical protein
MRSSPRAWLALGIAGLLSTLLTVAGHAQVTEGVYDGRFQGENMANNAVLLRVQSGALTGILTAALDTDVNRTGSPEPACIHFLADFSTAPIAIQGAAASGTVPLTIGTAQGRCADRGEPVEEPTDAFLSADLQGDVVTGSLRVGSPYGTFGFRATRRGGSAPTSQVPTTRDDAPAITELLAGSALTPETIDVLRSLERCTRADLEPGGRCAHYAGLRTAGNGMRGLGIDPALVDGALGVDALARMTDPQGRRLLPSLSPGMVKVVAKLLHMPDGEGQVAAHRLVALLVALDLEARPQ